MPTADGRFKGLSLSGKAGDAWDRIFGSADQSTPETASDNPYSLRACWERKWRELQK